MKHAKHLLSKTLTSRKFWATVAAVITFGLNGEWHEAGLALMAYVGAQGVVDAASRPTTPATLEADDDA